jgi:hypothetical protein
MEVGLIWSEKHKIVEKHKMRSKIHKMKVFAYIQNLCQIVNVVEPMAAFSSLCEIDASDHLRIYVTICDACVVCWLQRAGNILQGWG